MTKTVEELQIKLTNEPILILPNMKEEFVIETDACGYGVGGVLAQFRDNFYKPVAYFSRRLSKSERNYSTTKKNYTQSYYQLNISNNSFMAHIS
jgi:hypothetical protein